jgi:hypothetical protein
MAVPGSGMVCMADHQSYTFTIYADHLQFYLGDSLFEADTERDFWSDEANVRYLAIDPPSFIGVGTNYYGKVSVTLDVWTERPGDDLEGWDRVIEASLAVPSGFIAIDGCLAYVPEWFYRQMQSAHPGSTDTVPSPHISVEPGTYRVRVHAGATGTLRTLTTPTGEEEVTDEHYRIVLWPAPYSDPRILHIAS